MSSRLRFCLFAAALSLAGCGDRFNAGPLSYSKNRLVGTDPRNPEDPLQEKPRLRAAAAQALANLFGPAPDQIRVPEGAPLTLGGVHLANRVVFADTPEGQVDRPKYHSATLDHDVLQEGGYALYRLHCLHCHGVSGDGAGPTAGFLWPKPRDFRRGIFKFTSTRSPKPTREDLRRTIRHGIPNSSMPSFEALMSPDELEQVLDYLVFLSLRGETELSLLNEASFAEEDDAETAITDEVALTAAQGVFDLWKSADEDVLNPPEPRSESTDESLQRGKQLFLGQTPEKLQCAGCHGPRGVGNGTNFVPEGVFNAIVFWGRPITDYDEAMQALWYSGSLDDWGNPLRPANLNRGMYKGGRRPIDLYWRIATGIKGAKMPAHEAALKPGQIWDLVNFVLALPDRPELLEDQPLRPTAAPAPAAEVARR